MCFTIRLKHFLIPNYLILLQMFDSGFKDNVNFENFCRLNTKIMYIVYS